MCYQNWIISNFRTVLSFSSLLFYFNYFVIIIIIIIIIIINKTCTCRNVREKIFYV